MINVHLIIAALFLPLLLMMPMTGALYIWGFKGEVKKTEAFTISEPVPTETKEQEAFFRKHFAAQNLDYDFEYIKVNKTDYIFRPASRVHYLGATVDGNVVMTKADPSLLARLIELHKGHGPVAMRWFESIFGICLVLVTLSGLWLAVTVPTYRKATIISFVIGASVIAVCLI